jgi:hypothetical protein
MASSGNGKDLAALYIKRRAVLVTSFASMKLVCTEESCEQQSRIPASAAIAVRIHQAGRIAMTILSRRLKSAKKPRSCFNGKYFLLSSFMA